MVEVLTGKVREMIEEAKGVREERELGVKIDEELQKCSILDPDKPLIRLKVKHTGFPPLHNQRFGRQFEGEVANMGEILLFSKRRQMADTKVKQKRVDDIVHEIEEEEEEEGVQLDSLVREALIKTDSLGLICESEILEALDDFVKR